jgi:hypothetical protein
VSIYYLIQLDLAHPGIQNVMMKLNEEANLSAKLFESISVNEQGKKQKIWEHFIKHILSTGFVYSFYMKHIACTSGYVHFMAITTDQPSFEWRNRYEEGIRVII